MLRHLGIVAALSAAALAMAPAAAQDAAPAVPDNGAGPVIVLDDITVTAGKREQRLGDVDGSVTVRTGEELEGARVTRVEDLDKVFPGLVIRSRGNRAYANLSVRGVTSPDYYNPAIAVYVDGVPQDPADFTQELVDIERVELLRGPQGTLYGRNAHGGVINIVTRRPDDAFGGRVGGTLATKERAAAASVSGPLVPEILYGDIDLRIVDELGEIDDIATGESNIDDAETQLARASLRYAPLGSPLDIIATGRYERLRSHKEVYLQEPLVADREFDSLTGGGLPLLDRKVWSASLTGRYDFGKADLTSVTSFQKRTMKRLIFGRNTPEDRRQIAQEIRLSFEHGAIDGVVGGFFEDIDFERRTPGFTGFTGDSTNQVDTQSYALFGEATWAVTDAVDLTAGLRWSREEASIDFVQADPSGYAFEASDSFNDVSPKLAVGWQVTPDHRVYALASRGFKPGGFNHTVSGPSDQIPYDSEISTNLEVGWRGVMADGMVEAGASLYWILAQDKQIYVGPLGSQVLRNVGDATSRGIELDLRVRPAEGLTVGFGATLGLSTFDDGTVDPLTGADYGGNTLPYAPNQSYLLEASYVVAQTVLPGELTLRGAGRYFSKTWFDEANTLSQDGFTIVDASVELAMDNGLSLRLFADNITDKTFRTSSFDFGGGDIRSTIGEGRVVGIAGNFRF